MGLDFEYIDGQTPLNEEEKAGLLIASVTSRGELDEFEQLNIQKAVEWTMLRKFKAERILSEAFLLELHKRMYGDVWAWAGDFRKSDVSIGVSYFKIAMELKVLLDDARFWLEKGTEHERNLCSNRHAVASHREPTEKAVGVDGVDGTGGLSGSSARSWSGRCRAQMAARAAGPPLTMC